MRKIIQCGCVNPNLCDHGKIKSEQPLVSPLEVLLARSEPLEGELLEKGREYRILPGATKILLRKGQIRFLPSEKEGINPEAGVLIEIPEGVVGCVFPDFRLVGRSSYYYGKVQWIFSQKGGGRW